MPLTTFATPRIVLLSGIAAVVSFLLSVTFSSFKEQNGKSYTLGKTSVLDTYMLIGVQSHSQ